VNRAFDGRITLKELQQSDLPATMVELDVQQDINQVTRYFSYEHFYVIYCKFWELDTDHNQLIDKEDLLRYDFGVFCHLLIVSSDTVTIRSPLALSIVFSREHRENLRRVSLARCALRTLCGSY